MADAMLGVLYKLVFETKAQAENLSRAEGGEINDRARQAAIEKNKLLLHLIDVRTSQLISGGINENENKD